VRAFRPLTRLPKAAERLWNLIIQDMPSVTNYF
jgi:hypothetical protein